MQLFWIASLIFAVVIAIFAVQNNQPVSVNFLVWRLESVAVSTLVLAAAALGALLTYLLGLGRAIRHQMATRSARSELRQQEATIAELRARIAELEQQLHAGPARLQPAAAESGPTEVASPPASESRQAGPSERS